jgi:hypothetical protein
LVPNQFKVSNSPTLLGWNPTMSIEFILTQMESLYGKSSAAMLFANDTLFKSPLAANDTPESLFYRMEQCQEIMTLGNLAYTPEQVIANAVWIFHGGLTLSHTGIRDMGCGNAKNIPCPQDVFPRGVQP